MNLLEIISQVRGFLEQNGRISYRMLRRQFELDEETLEDLKEELIQVQRIAADEDGRVLIWTGQAPSPGRAEAQIEPPPERAPASYTPKHLAQRILTSRSALEGERKQVTVLFADVKGSMELAGQVDPEAWHGILDRFFQILADGVHRFEGTVNQYTGDGIMALFGAPIAHEDHAQRACYAALELHEQLAEHAREVKREHGLNLSTRIGLNSGEVVVGKIGDDLRMDYTAQGHTVGLAARMQELASPDTIYLADATAALASGYFDLRDLGAFQVKGVAGAVPVQQLQGVAEAQTRFDVSRSRGLTQFVGRDRDMAAMEDALEQAEAGNGQVVGVVAEAGTGKSRLCFEFLERCQREGRRVLRGQCVAHGRNISLLPILQVLREYYGITGHDSERTTREKIAGRMLLFDVSYREVLPLLFELLCVPDPDNPTPSMSAEERQRRLFGVIRSLVQRPPAEGTVVTLIEDLHWIDAASEAWVEQLVEAVAGSSNLLVVNFRPEYHADWMQKSWYRQLPLAPLGPEAVAELIRDLLGEDASLAGLAETIHTRTGGNPFFAEETVRGLIEAGNLEGMRGAYRLVTPIDELAIPPTVHSLLSARIDRLQERDKHVLQAASVIGTEFAEPILAAVVDLPRLDLSEALGVLKAAEFVYEEALYPIVEYAFKHPLTQEVALKSQLQDRRRRMHAAVAGALEEANADRLDERAALLAHHWDEAGDERQAARWHRRAAETIGFHHLEEALRHFRRLKELVDLLPPSTETLAGAATVRAQILWYGLRAGLPEREAETLFRESLELADRAEDPGAKAYAMLSYAIQTLYRGAGGEAPQLVSQAVTEADRTSDPGLRVAARWGVTVVGYFLGDLESSMRSADEGIALCGDDPRLGTELIGYSPFHFLLIVRGMLHTLQGRVREAEQDLTRATQAPDMMAHLAQLFYVQLCELTGDPRGALAHARRAAAGIEEWGATPAIHVFSQRELGAAHLQNGEWQEALVALEFSRETAYRFRTSMQTVAETLVRMAQARLELGELDRARETLDEARAAGERIGTRVHLPLVHRLRARLLRREEPNDSTAIEAALDDALRAARAMGARFHEPFLHLERAELADAKGDETLARRELEAAQALFGEMGAASQAERLARKLAAG
ncbi:MAG: adenylate/guanylate cyclase domain-containing protein [Myxococcota bacterium]